MISKFLQLEIPKRAKNCTKGGEEFVVGDDYFSVLDSDKEGFIREDFCLGCWAEAKKEWVNRAEIHWKSKVVQVKPISECKEEKTRDEKALELLKGAVMGLSQEEDEDAFLLALYLARRRFLYLRKEKQTAEGHFCFYEEAETEEMLCVKKVYLSASRITNAQQRLAIKLRKD